MDNNDKKALILATVREMAREIGPQNITAASICERAGVAPGSFQSIMGETFEEFLKAPWNRTPSDAPITLHRARPKHRRASILAAAVEVSEAGGYMRLTRDIVAEAAGVKGPTVGHYFKTMGALKAEVMATAIAEGFLGIIAQGLASNDRHALTVPRHLKQSAANHIAEK